MEDYTVELVESEIRSFQVKIPEQKEHTPQTNVVANFEANLHEPVDPKDTTVLIITHVSISDNMPDGLTVELDLYTVFSITPIPKDRKAVAFNYCMETIRKETIRRVQNILAAMGQELKFTE